MSGILYSTLLQSYIVIYPVRFVFIAFFLIRDLKHLAASKFWLPRGEGRTASAVGSADFLLIFPFLPMSVALLALSSWLDWLRLVIVFCLEIR